VEVLSQFGLKTSSLKGSTFIRLVYLVVMVVVTIEFGNAVTVGQHFGKIHPARYLLPVGSLILNMYA
jgi:hypothetical protein